MRKGQHEVVSAVLISGILITMVSTVYFWGLPLVYKSRDNSVIVNSENFMFFLDKTIKSTAAAAEGNREYIRISEPGILRISGGKIIYSVTTEGTIYAADASIPLGRTEDCDSSRSGIFGKDEPSVICVSSNQISESEFTNVYTLAYRSLESGLKIYQISLSGSDITAPKSNLIIENMGVSPPVPTPDGKETVSVNVRITIQ